MLLEEAKIIAQDVRRQLSPFCMRIEIAGSIRREKPEVKDIEICAIPKVEEVPDGLFDKKMVVSEGFVSQVNKWEKIKGEPTGKYTRRIIKPGVELDLFLCGSGNWGLIFAIRTGSAEFSHKILMAKIIDAGYLSKGGMLLKRGVPVPTRTEEELFDLINMEVRFYSPINRELGR